MHKQVLRAVVRLDEAVTFCDVEPLADTCRHPGAAIIIIDTQHCTYPSGSAQDMLRSNAAAEGQRQMHSEAATLTAALPDDFCATHSTARLRLAYSAVWRGAGICMVPALRATSPGSRLRANMLAGLGAKGLLSQGKRRSTAVFCQVTDVMQTLRGPAAAACTDLLLAGGQIGLSA